MIRKSLDLSVFSTTVSTTSIRIADCANTSSENFVLTPTENYDVRSANTLA